MASPFLGQIQPFGFTFAPRGWALCNGQILPISQNTALFSLLGTQYGGDGKTTFALPNLQSRVPMHQGQSPVGTIFNIGDRGGVEAVTLTVNELPAHNHGLSGTTAAADSKNPGAGAGGAAFAQSVTAAGVTPGDNFYAPITSPGTAPLNPATLGVAGGNQPHANLQPCLAVNFCIATQGIFPSRN